MTRDDQVFNRGSKDSDGNVIKGSGEPGQCRVPWCTNPGKHPQGRRGLCHTHRVYAHNAIQGGVTTEKDLVKRGLMLPAKSVNVRKNPTGKLKPKALKRKDKKTKGKSSKIKVRRRKNPSNDRCVFPKCKTKAHAKGLCKPHYGQAKRRLRQCKSNPAKNRLLGDWKRRKLWIEDKAPERSNPFDLGSKIKGSRRK